MSLWSSEVGILKAKKEILQFFQFAFGTPNQKNLSKIIIFQKQMISFLTPFLVQYTAAVAHKMGRRYIGIEMGEHAVTHCVPRLQKVIEGEQGISRGQLAGRGGVHFIVQETILIRASDQPCCEVPPLAAHGLQRHTPLVQNVVASEAKQPPIRDCLAESTAMTSPVLVSITVRLIIL
jgi:adenine-specific DNA-methyltransferase